MQKEHNPDPSSSPAPPLSVRLSSSECHRGRARELECAVHVLQEGERRLRIAVGSAEKGGVVGEGALPGFILRWRHSLPGGNVSRTWADLRGTCDWSGRFLWGACTHARTMQKTGAPAVPV